MASRLPVWFKTGDKRIGFLDCPGPVAMFSSLPAIRTGLRSFTQLTLVSQIVSIIFSHTPEFSWQPEFRFPHFSVPAHPDVGRPYELCALLTCHNLLWRNLIEWWHHHHLMWKYHLRSVSTVFMAPSIHSWHSPPQKVLPTMNMFSLLKGLIIRFITLSTWTPFFQIYQPQPAGDLDQSFTMTVSGVGISSSLIP